MDSEHRKDPRLGIEREVRIELADGSIVGAVLADVSKSGARLTTKLLANLPDQFLLKLSDDVQRWSRIVWRTADQAGLQFIPAPQLVAESAARRPVLIKCPRTGKAISTGMQLSTVADLYRISAVRRFFQCPYCNVSHGWMPTDAFVP
jgi:hypothetical protein